MALTAVGIKLLIKHLNNQTLLTKVQACQRVLALERVFVDRLFYVKYLTKSYPFIAGKVYTV